MPRWLIPLGIVAVILAGWLGWWQMRLRFWRARLTGRPFEHYNTELVGQAWGFASARMLPYWRKLFTPDAELLPEERAEHAGSLFHRLKRIGAVWVSQADQVPHKALSCLAVDLVLIMAAGLVAVWFRW